MPEKTDAPKPLPHPESGKKPERITTESSPGGPQTPGAKQARRRAERIANKKTST